MIELIKVNTYDKTPRASIGLVLAPNTDEVLEEMMALEADIKSCSRYMFAQVKGNLDQPIPHFFATEWHDFVAKWNRFFENNKGFWSRFVSTSGIYNRTQDFRREFIAVRESSKRVGFRFTGPDPMPPAETPMQEIRGFVRGLAYVVLIAAGVIVAVILYRLFT